MRAPQRHAAFFDDLRLEREGDPVRDPLPEPIAKTIFGPKLVLNPKARPQHATGCLQIDLRSRLDFERKS